MIKTSKQTTLKQLRKIPVTPPVNAGGYWKGIAHAELLDMVKHHWPTIYNQTVVTKNNGTEMIAAAQVLHLHKDYQVRGGVPFLAIRNSYSGHVATRLFAGFYLIDTMASLCCTEYFLGKHTVDRKEMDEQMAAGTRWINRQYTENAKKLRAMEMMVLDTVKDVEPLLLHAARVGLLSWSRLRLVDQKYHSGPPTAFHLLHAFAQVSQKSPPLNQLGYIHDFWQLLTKEQK